MFDCVLVANRGEIARRVIRTLDRLGVRSVAIHTDADAFAPHAREADVARRVESYLDIESVLAAAEGVDAIHPGYGFLSENAAFARACAGVGIVFVGPSADAIELMGDKQRAKAVAERAGVPVVPSYTVEEARAATGDYPLLVKAAAGGGGRGMRVVEAPEGLDDAVAAARREAQAGFGDDRVFVERFLARARHLEVQLLGDLALGERECSLQRRHQKLVEEAPSPSVSPELRERLCAEASALARAAGYENAGTVEFIADAGDLTEHFFLEVNARLQVEHPVTEMVTGLDLVECQLRIAAGEPLPFDSPPEITGHAIEARVNAEDERFFPQAGSILRYVRPGGAHVRVDDGIEAGSVVGTGYDSLLGKVNAHGPDRTTALARLDRALAQTAILGVTTNVGFLRRLIALDAVRAGELDTGLVERTELAPAPAPGVARAAAAIDFADHNGGDGWRLGGARAPSWWLLQVEGEEPVEVELPAGTAPEPGWVHARDGDILWLGRDGHAWRVREPSIEETQEAAIEGDLRAPMPGSVLVVAVSEGDEVTAGDTIVVLESMKMELSIDAPADGVVEALSVSVGDSVKQDQPLARVA